jgi:PAS domain S-box-containing protein
MFGNFKSKGIAPSVLIKGASIGAIIGLFIFSPTSMIFSDFIHEKFPHEHIIEMLSSRWVGIMELFRIEAILWNAHFAIIGGAIGFFISLSYGKLHVRKREIEEIKNELDAILSHIAEGVLVVDRDHNIKFMNNTMKKNYGDKGVNMSYESIHPNPASGNANYIESIINNEKETLFYEGVDKEGREFEVTATPLRYKDDTLVVEIYRDVTERNKLMKSLAQSDKMITMGHLSAGIAHELRNPLCAIDAARFYMADVLKDEDPSIKEELESIERGVKRAQKIITDLLDFSRDSTEEREKVNINRVLETTLALINDELLVKDIELNKRFADVPNTFLNSGPMKQAFLNIIVNAIQAMDKTGRLEIATQVSEDKKLLRVMIRDSGPGISKKNISNVFQPFFTTKKGGEGTGLGLAITKSIIERDGGFITLESEIGTGTTFHIELPVCDSPQCACYPASEGVNKHYDFFLTGKR